MCVCVALVLVCWASQVELVVRNSPVNVGVLIDTVSIPGSGRSPGRGYGNPLQHFCPENPMDRGAWWATVSPWDHTESSGLAHVHAGLSLDLTTVTYVITCSVMSDSLDTMDYRPPGSSIHGIFQARILEWAATFYSRGSSQLRD